MNPLLHLGPQITNNETTDEQGPPPNPQLQQIPTSNQSSLPMDRQDPSPNLQLQQTSRVTNDETMDEQDLPPNPQLQKIPTSKQSSLPTDEQDPPPNPQLQQTSRITNDKTMDKQDLPPNPQLHQTPELVVPYPHNGEIPLPTTSHDLTTTPLPTDSQEGLERPPPAESTPHTHDPTFQPPIFKENPFLFQSEPGRQVNMSRSRGQILGRRLRDSLRQGRASK